MLNNAWPSLIWHLYDWYLRPGGGYYGTKKACEPLHVQYSWDDRSVAVVNDLQQPFAGLKVTAEVFDIALASRFSKTATVDVAADAVVRAFPIPKVAGLSTTYFLRLKAEDAQGRLQSRNFYWLSTKEDVLDWKNKKWFHTPTKRHGDVTALARLPGTTLAVNARFDDSGPEGTATVVVENTGKALAFMTHLRVVEGAEEILPVFWDDNYFELFPGEKREVKVAFPRGTGALSVTAEAWNAALAK
jgi:exo-1,4-beta-D-glucosaminidase